MKAYVHVFLVALFLFGLVSVARAEDKKFYYCKTQFARCVQTSNNYPDVNACQANVQKYFENPNPGSTTDKCYATQEDCAQDCASSSNAILQQKPLETKTVTVVVSGSGLGTITADQGGLFCQSGHTCSIEVAQNSFITFRATPDSHSDFGGWGKPCAENGSNPCVINVNNMGFTLEASFTPKAAPAAPANQQNQTNSTGTSNSNGNNTNPNSNSNPGRNSTSTSSSATFNVQITKSGSGTGTVAMAVAGQPSCTPTCGLTFPAGSVAVLVATANSDSAFGGWSGQCNTILGNLCIIKMDVAKSVTVTFNPKPSPTLLNVQVVKNGSGTGTVAMAVAGQPSCTPTCGLTFPAGSVAVLVATANSDSAFGGWSGQCNTILGNLCIIKMDVAKSVTVVFNPKTVSLLEKFARSLFLAGATTQYTLQVQKTGNGAGSVMSYDRQIACGNMCSAQYDDQAITTLIATAVESTSSFTGWTGNCNTILQNFCVIRVDAAKTIAANFTLDQTKLTFPLSINLDGIGTVTSSPVGIACGSVEPTGSVCAKDFSLGKTVTLTAAPKFNSSAVFSRWSGGCASVQGNTCVVHMDSAKTITASFAYPPLQSAYSLRVAVSGSEGAVASNDKEINCRNGKNPLSACVKSYIYGSIATLIATPSPSSVFVEWSGDCTTILQNICILRIDSDKTITASFRPKNVAQSLYVVPIGGGLVRSSIDGINCGDSCVAQYQTGSELGLTAIPSSGTAFIGWYGACVGTGQCALTMDSSKFVYALFQPSSYSLTIVKKGGGSVFSSPDGVRCGKECSVAFAPNSRVTLTATPNEGYVFSRWSGSPACATKPVCSIILNSNRQMTATFKKASS